MFQYGGLVTTSLTEFAASFGIWVRASPRMIFWSRRILGSPFNSLFSRVRASFTYLLLSSIPIPFRPSTAAAFSVDPTPTNGSRTVSPDLVKKRISRATSWKENGAGCCFFDLGVFVVLSEASLNPYGHCLRNPFLGRKVV